MDDAFSTPAPETLSPGLVLDHDHVVVKLDGPAHPNWAKAVLSDGGATYAVAASTSAAVERQRRSGTRIGPLYRAEGGRAVAVPTGRVAVKVAAGADLDTLRRNLESLGFRTVRKSERMLFVEPNEDNVAAALGRIESVSALPGAESASPQILYESFRK